MTRAEPTFTLVQTLRRRPAWYGIFDLYRLTSPDEVHELGLDEALVEASC